MSRIYPSSPAQASEIAQRLGLHRSDPVAAFEDVTPPDLFDSAEREKLIQKTKTHPGAPLAADVIAALVELRELEPETFENLRSQLRKAGARVSAIDAAIKKHEAASAAAAKAAIPAEPPRKRDGHEIELRQDEAAAEPQDGAALLDDVTAFIARHVFLPHCAAEAAALWAIGTYCHQSFRIFPRLAILSPQKGCGKTTFLDVLEFLILRPVYGASVTPAAIFRLIEAAHPSLLIDEADRGLSDNQDLVAVLNAGHKRGATVLRTVGDAKNCEVRAFDCFAPVALAAIKTLADTILDRSIKISLVRATKAEAPAPFSEHTEAEATTLRRRIMRWAADNNTSIAARRPKLPSRLINRQADNWRPLAAIAEIAGGTGLRWSLPRARRSQRVRATLRRFPSGC